MLNGQPRSGSGFLLTRIDSGRTKEITQLITKTSHFTPSDTKSMNQLSSRRQHAFMAERPLERRLHLHLTELADGELQVLSRLSFFLGSSLEE